MFAPLSISDSFQNPAFASTNNENTVLRGISKATVTSDCNETKELIEFAPQNVRDVMESVWHTYVWEQPDPDEPLIGLFRTDPSILQFDSQYISGIGAFDRRQIYSTEEDTAPAICDCVLISDYDTIGLQARIQTKRDRIFAGGSLRFSGTIYKGVELKSSERHRGLTMRIGIGTDINNAQWFYTAITAGTWDFSYGWNGTRTNTFFLFETMEIGQVITGTSPGESASYVIDRKYPAIPIDGNMFGKVFVEFLGSPADEYKEIAQNFQIGNFKLEYSRDTTVLGTRARMMVRDRKNSRDYTSTNVNPCNDEWKADCIFASDNYMEYGYGLLMNTDGSFMTTAPYGNTPQQPEQHLANRVASYWNGTKHRIDAELQSHALASGTAINDISPRHKVTIGGVTGDPVAISHDWRDDVVTLTVIEDTANVN
jgi:hypothetical protein